MELPYFQKYYEVYSEEGLQIVAINIFAEQDELLPEWRERLGIQFPILVGANIDRIIEDYQLESTPLSFLLDSEGKIIERFDEYYPGAEEKVEEAIRRELDL